ncbi:MAG: hypothetical protein JWM11_2782, partial [Planctomycetaceae bacterium]|nr:hypothetical protein [Planctomycetaceae bacterium]
MQTTSTLSGNGSSVSQEASSCPMQKSADESGAACVNVGQLERAISVVAGGACIIMAPSRSIWGCLMTLSGLGLMYRAM